jgi:hypothetical protein
VWALAACTVAGGNCYSQTAQLSLADTSAHQIIQAGAGWMERVASRSSLPGEIKANLVYRECPLPGVFIHSISDNIEGTCYGTRHRGCL